jgi:hypothetical protein
MGDNEIDDNKNTHQTLGNHANMRMRWWDAGHNARWSTSQASLEGECLHPIPTVAAMVNDNLKTLTKNYF